MARARKLFPIYGSALANNMFTALGRGRVVDRFVAAYVAEYDRAAILGGASRDRELAETIGREAMLAMIHEVPQILPRFFGKKQYAALKTEEKEAMNAFVLELMAALGRVWGWNAQDRRQFGHDLDMYSECAARPVKLAKGRKRGKVRGEDPPFIGRVALLLDPSMLDQARRAAREFHEDVRRLARKILSQTLHSRS
jgi:predicted RNA-binding Zn ribbon-like protein